MMQGVKFDQKASVLKARQRQGDAVGKSYADQSPFVGRVITKWVQNEEGRICRVNDACDEGWEVRKQGWTVRNKQRWWPSVKNGVSINIIPRHGTQALGLISPREWENLVVELGQSGPVEIAKKTPFVRKWEATLNDVGGSKPLIPASLKGELPLDLYNWPYRLSAMSRGSKGMSSGG
jgi:hypothetical protein